MSCIEIADSGAKSTSGCQPMLPSLLSTMKSLFHASRHLLVLTPPRTPSSLVQVPPQLALETIHHVAELMEITFKPESFLARFAMTIR
jgi:hypothetical protein